MRKLLVQSTVTLSAEEYDALHKPCVYLFWDDRKCLYIGCSERGIARALTPDHNVRSLLKEAGIKIFRTEIRWCDSLRDAKELEALLIERTYPVFNNTRPIPSFKKDLMSALHVNKEQLDAILKELQEKENAKHGSPTTTPSSQR
jgi:hypothetical protein